MIRKIKRMISRCYYTLKAWRTRYNTDKQFKEISGGMIFRQLTRQQEREIKMYYKSMLGWMSPPNGINWLIP